MAALAAAAAARPQANGRAESLAEQRMRARSEGRQFQGSAPPPMVTPPTRTARVCFRWISGRIMPPFYRRNLPAQLV